MKTNTAIGDLNVCKDAANQFYMIAQKCIGKSIADYFMTGFYPYAVNLAFACELYMKAIMIYRSPKNEFCKGHDLRELFLCLDIVDKQYIEREFGAKNPSKNLDKFLTEDGKTFIDWRYALEKPVEMSLTGFQALSEILNNYVETLK